MICKDISFAEPADNLLYEDVLLQQAETGRSGEVLRFWESSVYFIVLGKIGKAEDDIRLQETLRDGVPVLRRSSGGGTVLQGPGCLNYSLILRKDREKGMADLRQSYGLILEKVVQALSTLGVDTEYLPVSDLALTANHRKISGNAQKRGRQYILHHGTLLYDFDLAKIEQYLTMPKDMPLYRGKREHLDFVTNVSLGAAAFKKALQDAFAVSAAEELHSEEEKRLEDLRKEKSVIVPLSI